MNITPLCARRHTSAAKRLSCGKVYSGGKISNKNVMKCLFAT
jgi:hypothetical protein